MATTKHQALLSAAAAYAQVLEDGTEDGGDAALALDTLIGRNLTGPLEALLLDCLDPDLDPEDAAAMVREILTEQG